MSSRSSSEEVKFLLHLLVFYDPHLPFSGGSTVDFFELGRETLIVFGWNVFDGVANRMHDGIYSHSHKRRWSYDLEKQRELADKYEQIEEIKQYLINKIIELTEIVVV